MEIVFSTITFPIRLHVTKVLMTCLTENGNKFVGLLNYFHVPTQKPNSHVLVVNELVLVTTD